MNATGLLLTTNLYFSSIFFLLDILLPFNCCICSFLAFIIFYILLLLFFLDCFFLSLNLSISYFSFSFFYYYIFSFFSFLCCSSFPFHYLMLSFFWSIFLFLIVSFIFPFFNGVLLFPNISSIYFPCSGIVGMSPLFSII